MTENNERAKLPLKNTPNRFWEMEALDKSESLEYTTEDLERVRKCHEAIVEAAEKAKDEKDPVRRAAKFIWELRGAIREKYSK
jgi:hypothetical protein